MNNKKKKTHNILIIIALFFIIVGLWVFFDVHENNQIEKIESIPSGQEDGNITGVLWALENGEIPDYEQVHISCDYIDARYDKSDFLMQVLLKIMYDYEDDLPEEVKARIKSTCLNFKYWMDQPGEDGMCYWSENHQILFASSEYLAGQFYADEIFTNDEKTGADHSAMGRERILIWLEQRWKYGFSEWYSNTYYKEDIIALSNLIEYSKDEEIVKKAEIIMDLLFYDVATQSNNGTFLSTSGRLYEDNKKSGQGNRLNRIMEMIFGVDLQAEDKQGGLDLIFLYAEKYQLPGVLQAIALDQEAVEIKASNGLGVDELETEGLLGLEDSQIMMQWAMEAFTNPLVVENSLAYIDMNHMYSNAFLYDFRYMNIDLIKKLSILPKISELMNFKTNGAAIQRANTYTYKTSDYMLATAQSYYPGEFADQQHIWTANLSNDVSVFTTHPARQAGESGTPNYWVGSGRLPHSVQEENVNLTIYRIPDKTGFMEEELLFYTHAYFPMDLMDEVLIEERYVFGRVGDSYVAMIAFHPLEYAVDSTEDLIQNGQITYWITELSSKNEESFEEFQRRIHGNPIIFDEERLSLSYETGGKDMSLTYQGEFYLDGNIVDTEYERFESPYAIVERNPETIEIEYMDQYLFLDFYNMKREER